MDLAIYGPVALHIDGLAHLWSSGFALLDNKENRNIDGVVNLLFCAIFPPNQSLADTIQNSMKQKSALT